MEVFWLVFILGKNPTFSIAPYETLEACEQMRIAEQAMRQGSGSYCVSFQRPRPEPDKEG